MSLADKKLTPGAISTYGVTAAPDRLTGTAAQNKALFDRLVRDAFAGLYNGLIDALEEYGAEHIVQYTDGDGKIVYIRLNSDRVLETSVDGEEWQATGSSGHIIEDAAGNELPQRSRMKFMNGTVTDNGTETVITAMKGDTGDTGPQGPQGIQGVQGDKGDKGAAWYPEVDSLGNLTFTLSDTVTPPPIYNIRGPQGPQGVQGLQGATGSQGRRAFRVFRAYKARRASRERPARPAHRVQRVRRAQPAHRVREARQARTDAISKSSDCTLRWQRCSLHIRPATRATLMP